MEKFDGFTVYTREELKYIKNTKIIILEMIQNNYDKLKTLDKECEEYRLITCQSNALCNALSALNQVIGNKI